MQLRSVLRLLCLLTLVLFMGCGGGGSTNNANNNGPQPQSPVTVTPATITTAPGQSAVFTVTLQANTLPTTPVVLSVTNLPANATASFNPPQVTFANGATSGASALTITTDPATPLGTYSFTVQGTVDNAVFGTAQAILKLQSTGTQKDFTLNVTPASAAVQQSIPAVFNITVNPLNGFTGNVSLTITGGNGNFIVSGPTPSALTLDGQTPAQAAFTVTLASNAATGNSQTPLTITATGDSITRTATVTLQAQQ